MSQTKRKNSRAGRFLRALAMGIDFTTMTGTGYKPGGVAPEYERIHLRFDPWRSQRPPVKRIRVEDP